LPRALRAIEVAWARRLDPAAKAYSELRPLRAEDLDTDALGRLLARAEARACRLPTAAHQVNRDWFWIGAELALVLPKVHPKVVRRWRQRVGWAVYHAEWQLDRLRQLVATILAHEPETDAWLRRRLGDLNGFHA
jgi:hypothetical protein